MANENLSEDMTGILANLNITPASSLDEGVKNLFSGESSSEEALEDLLNKIAQSLRQAKEYLERIHTLLELRNNPKASMTMVENIALPNDQSPDFSKSIETYRKYIESFLQNCLGDLGSILEKDRKDLRWKALEQEVTDLRKHLEEIK